MANDITVVCQGRYLPETIEAINSYLDYGLQVIYSGWEGYPIPLTHRNLICCYSTDPVNPGVTNRNRQIVSSRRGLELVQTKYAWKVRSDQIYPVEAIKTYLDFFENHPDRDRRIFTPGLYTKEVFHFRDHQTLGKLSDIKRFWSCELDPYDGPPDYNAVIRSETYFVVNYLDFYCSAVMSMRLRWRDYLLDNSPKRLEALEKTNQLMPKYFVPMPRVLFYWPKHNMFNGYHYDYCEKVHGEYWAS